MRLIGLKAIYPKPKTSRPHPQHKIYPYLLRGFTIDRPNQLWVADITYIPMSRGFMYLDRSWTGTVAKCSPGGCPTLWRPTSVSRRSPRPSVATVSPEIFNTDQGAQFTSETFTGLLQSQGVAISMDGRGRCQNNIFIERLWWTLKHHYLYLHSFCGGSELRDGLRYWFNF